MGLSGRLAESLTVALPRVLAALGGGSVKRWGAATRTPTRTRTAAAPATATATAATTPTNRGDTPARVAGAPPAAAIVSAGLSWAAPTTTGQGGWCAAGALELVPLCAC